MSIVSSVVRVKLAIFAVICFVLWQALKTVPSMSPFPNEDSNPKAEVMIATDGSFVPVQVAVYYEALCPDSRSFIVKQLLPTYQKAARLIDTVLVPYGKAQTEELPGKEITFTCQHGPVECKANKIHACTIDKVPNKEIQLKYISCMIQDNMEPEVIGEKCGRSLDVPWDPILKCARGAEGSELLKHYGEMTYALDPSVSFIPTILLNKSQDNQAAILKNLLREVCNKFKHSKPVECG